MVQAHDIAKEVYFMESELQKCRRSLLIHNVEMWVEADKETKGFSPSDRTTANVHFYIEISANNFCSIPYSLSQFCVPISIFRENFRSLPV